MVICKTQFIASRKRESKEESERAREGREKGGGCLCGSTESLQADNTLNHRWLGKVARKWENKVSVKRVTDREKRERERERK